MTSRLSRSFQRSTLSVTGCISGSLWNSILPRFSSASIGVYLPADLSAIVLTKAEALAKAGPWFRRRGLAEKPRRRKNCLFLNIHA
jgi:hypothetical protein